MPLQEFHNHNTGYNEQSSKLNMKKILTPVNLKRTPHIANYSGSFKTGSALVDKYNDRLPSGVFNYNCSEFATDLA